MNWKASITPQAKQLLWRIAHNSLPHRWSILRQGTDVDLVCPMCHRFNEDGSHLFLRCKPVRALWKALKIDHIRLKLLLCADAKEVIGEILKQEEHVKLKCVALFSVWWKIVSSTHAMRKRNYYRRFRVRIHSITSSYACLTRFRVT